MRTCRPAPRCGSACRQRERFVEHARRRRLSQRARQFELQQAAVGAQPDGQLIGLVTQQRHCPRVLSQVQPQSHQHHAARLVPEARLSALELRHDTLECRQGRAVQAGFGLIARQHQTINR